MKQTNHRTIRLTPAQEGAFECLTGGGLEPEDAPQMAAAWRGGRLVFEVADAEALFAELNEASNSEDAQAEYLRGAGEREAAALAGRAARSLAAIAGRVLLGEAGR